MSQIHNIAPGVIYFDVAEKDYIQLYFNETECHVEFNHDKRYSFPLSDLKGIVVRGQNEPIIYPPAHSSDFINHLLSDLDITRGHFVDIGAFDGISHSNTFPLIQQGWSGLSFEADRHRFVKMADLYRLLPVDIAATFVTPANVVNLLKGFNTPQSFDFLSIDIDSFDYYVLEALLSAFRPTVIVAEVNEVIPPPLKFSMNYGPGCEMSFKKRFYGQSLAQLQLLCERFGYHIIHLYYMDVILIDKAYAEGEPQSLESLYQTGFKDLPRPSYYQDYPFDIESVQSASPAEALEIIKHGYAEFEGQFTLTL